MLLISACSNNINESADLNECREVAYGSHNDAIANNSDGIFSECSSKKEALRAEAQKKENVDNWFDFLEVLFGLGKSSNK